jgi:hypothetical protein
MYVNLPVGAMLISFLSAASDSVRPAESLPFTIFSPHQVSVQIFLWLVCVCGAVAAVQGIQPRHFPSIARAMVSRPCLHSSFGDIPRTLCDAGLFADEKKPNFGSIRR